ncbi:MAG TPA: endonuclease/exonuclease/phosphatase family protein [Bacteroidia bacterium]|jgi:exonuclease III|nr:endonuclease/exonuclease/phosphatase family protein [Bacteroidia bacterium]
MKLITWNCQGAFRTKAKHIFKYEPDILVIQECEHPSRLKLDNDFKKPKNIYWIGDNHHKGLAVISYCEYDFKIHKNYNPNIKFVLPINIKGSNNSFNLLAIWANNKNDPEGQYVEQVWKAIQHYKNAIKNNPVILTGDFNSNTIWDRPKRIGNHSHVVEKLASYNIHSVYHTLLNQQQGKEIHPTFYLYRNLEKPYHLDYCFATDHLQDKITHIEFGEYSEWINHSDHMPIILEFDL